MGKIRDRSLPQQIQVVGGIRNSSNGIGRRCSMAFSSIRNSFSFKCFFVLILSASLLLSSLFRILPFRSVNSGFEAEATIQVYFKLERPVSLLVPHIGRLEYEINGEIGIPSSKVSILSMHQSVASNWTDVVFGILSDSKDVPLDPVPLSILKSSLIELVLGQVNLTLTTSIFGHPSSFQILKLPGGVTVIPLQYASIWQIPQTLFNFTLYNTISDILEYFDEFKGQLKVGLHLKYYENIYVLITNEAGSTVNLPVTVQASVLSDFGSLLPQRLKQLAQTITGSPPAKNLGLDNSVFGKVKEVSLSSYLDSTLYAAPTPSPSPSPSPFPSGENDYMEPSMPPYPAFSPSSTPALSPDIDHISPCLNCIASSPSDGSSPNVPSPENEVHQSSPISSSPAPSVALSHPPCPCPFSNSVNLPSSPPTSHPNSNLPPTVSPCPAPCLPSGVPTPHASPSLSPMPIASNGNRPGWKAEHADFLISPSYSSPAATPSVSSSAAGPIWIEILLTGLCSLIIFNLMCWSNR
ncbi:hypothetical protein RJ641_013123 [Dillenia turbinata]|uniref:DUF7036 domain-containing protein n=1 Tax=Dillenia turbinata TaxID=194707 RepID=A0AAN8W3P6_9MAGN